MDKKGWTRRGLAALSTLFLAPESLAAPSSVLTPQSFGAKGDGLSDDSVPIQEMMKQLHEQTGATLFFPSGTYRWTQPKASPIDLHDVSDVLINFDPHAVLLIDNMIDGTFGTAAVRIGRGCKRITVTGASVTYSSMPLRRENGFGAISVDGAGRGVPPSQLTAFPSEIKIKNCKVMNSPAVMFYINSADNIILDNVSGRNSWADGIYVRDHTNVLVNGASILNAGDDGISFGRYGLPEGREGLGGRDGSGQGSQASNIVIDGIYAGVKGDTSGGIFVGGAKNCSFTNISVRNRARGIRFEIGAGRKWAFQAPTNLNISNIDVENCLIGIFIDCWGSAANNNDVRYTNSGVNINNIRIKSCGRPILADDSAYSSGSSSGFSLRNIVVSGEKDETQPVQLKRLGRWEIDEFHTTVPFILSGTQSGPELSKIHVLNSSAQGFQFSNVASLAIENLNSISPIPSGFKFINCANVAAKGLTAAGVRVASKANGPLTSPMSQ